MHEETRDWGRVEHLVGPERIEEVEQPKLAHNGIQLDHLFLKAGGFSSIHLHQHKANAFILLDGAVDVVTFKRVRVDGQTHDDDKRHDPRAWEEDQRFEMRAHGDNAMILPNRAHKFEALEDSELLEFYWRMSGPNPVSLDDIRRFIPRGCHASA